MSWPALEVTPACFYAVCVHVHDSHVLYCCLVSVV